MPAPHNVLGSRISLDHKKEIAQLDWAHGEETLKFHAKNDPDKVYSLVVKYEPESGYFELYLQWHYAREFGGDILQERTIGDVIARAAQKRAKAQAESEEF